MATAKTYRAVNWLLFAYLAIFPLGQLLRLQFLLFGHAVRFQPIDIVAGLFLILWLFEKFERPKVYKQLSRFVAVLLFSAIFSVTYFDIRSVISGILYLIRIVSYFSFFLVLHDYFKNHSGQKELILKSLLSVGVLIAILGWLQYIFVPYFGSFRVWGWDDHLYRLIGSFLDPAFTGLLLVLAFFISLILYFNSRKNIFMSISLGLIISVMFTYSRASYLALVAGFFTWSVLVGKLRYFLLILLSLVFLIFLLPRPGGAGTHLERTFSISDRFKNYSQTIEVAKYSPVFGVGYNNLCVARKTLLNYPDIYSHSCSGSDSSLLLILATTGVIGIFVFFNLAIRLIRNSERGIFGLLFLVSLTAVFIHSFFVNSMFYPWVMGWMAILASLAQSRLTRSS